MVHNRSFILLFVLLFAILLPARSAEAQVRWIHVESNWPDANVYADSTWMGTVSMRYFLLPADTHILTIVPAMADIWSIPPRSYSFEKMGAEPQQGIESDTLNLELNFPFYYSLESIPSMANVYMDDDSGRELLGRTPLLYQTEQALVSDLVFERDGFRPRRIKPGQQLWNRYLVALEANDMDPGTLPDVSLGEISSRHRWIDYAALGTAFAGGILAVHFKTKADNRFDEYAETGERGLRSEVKRLDVYSGVALGAMQVGLGVFAIRLIF